MAPSKADAEEAGSPDAEAGKGRRPLGRMEEAEVITNEHFPFNAVIILRLTGGPSADTLKNILPLLRHRHPLLSARVSHRKGRYFLITADTPGIPLKVVERENDEQWLTMAEEELNREFDVFTGPLSRWIYLTDGAGMSESELILTFQHLIMDASSSAGLIHEILSLCREIESGVPVGELPELKRLPLLPSAETFFPAGYKGVRRRWKIIRFALRQMGDEIRYQWRSRRRRKAPIHPSGNCKILSMKFSQEVTGALTKHARKKRLSLNNLLSAAMLTAVHRTLYDGEPIPLRFVHMADLRPYLSPPMDASHLGSYFSMMRLTVAMKRDPDVWQLARRVNDIAYSSFKRGDKFSTNLMSAAMMRALFRFRSFRMAAAAMSYTGPVPLEKRYGKIEVQDIHAFVSNFVLGPEYTAQVRWFDHRLYWDILYLDSDMDHKKAAEMADLIRTILESAVKE